MKYLVVALGLCLMACSPDVSAYYFVPEMQMYDGAIVQTNTFPVPTLKDCVALAAQFNKEMKEMGDKVLSYSSDCVRSHLVIRTPDPATVKHVEKEGTI
jgi:hypothetical protein